MRCWPGQSMKIAVAPAVALILPRAAFAVPFFKTSKSTTPGDDVLNRELNGISGYFQSLHAAVNANAGNMGAGADTGEGESARGRGGNTPLPSLSASAAAVLNFDPSLFLKGADPEGEFMALLVAELAAHSAHPDPSTTFSYVVCGPQATASTARDALTEINGGMHHEVRFSVTVADCGF